jgi:hypothetical protein
MPGVDVFTLTLLTNRILDGGAAKSTKRQKESGRRLGQPLSVKFKETRVSTVRPLQRFAADRGRRGSLLTTPPPALVRFRLPRRLLAFDVSAGVWLCRGGLDDGRR